jgi:hypothetical protein
MIWSFLYSLLSAFKTHLSLAFKNLALWQQLNRREAFRGSDTEVFRRVRSWAVC